MTANTDPTEPELNQYNDLVFRVYEKQFRWFFRFHPKLEEIMEKLRTDTATMQEIAIWFSENELYLMERFGAFLQKELTGDTVTFKIYNKERNALESIEEHVVHERETTDGSNGQDVPTVRE